MRRLSGGGGSSVKWRRGKNIVSRVGEKMAMTLHIQARHFGVTAGRGKDQKFEASLENSESQGSLSTE